jgi:hypothetical protein
MPGPSSTVHAPCLCKEARLYSLYRQQISYLALSYPQDGPAKFVQITFSHAEGPAQGFLYWPELGISGRFRENRREGGGRGWQLRGTREEVHGWRKPERKLKGKGGKMEGTSGRE